MNKFKHIIWTIMACLCMLSVIPAVLWLAWPTEVVADDHEDEASPVFPLDIKMRRFDNYMWDMQPEPSAGFIRIRQIGDDNHLYLSRSDMRKAIRWMSDLDHSMTRTVPKERCKP